MDTYSFLDCILNVSFSTGTMTITGKGLGDITVAMDQERSAMDVSNDGNVVVSKIAGSQGRLTVNIQQTSAAYKFLLAAYNANILAPPSTWASGLGILRCSSNSISHTLTGISFQKMPDTTYTKQVSMASFILLVADIQNLPF